MFLVYVNYLAVLLCAVSSMIIGIVWYGPLFGKEWMKMVGMTKEKMEKTKEGMAQTYGIMFISSLVMAYVLAHFIWYASPGTATVLIGVKTAIWAWLGFVATVMFSKFLFSVDKKPMKLFFIDSAYYLVTLMVMGFIIAVLH